MEQWLLRLSFLFVVLTAASAAATHTSDTIPQDNIFDQEQHEAFQRDGFVVVSGMLDPILVQNLEHAANLTVEITPKIPFFFSVTKQGAMFGSQKNCTADESEGDVAVNAFRQAALFSDLPRAAAELMQLDPETQNVRILRDLLLARAIDDYKPCDWHVDDNGFWPESFISTVSERSGKDQNGINAWIALDDMPAIYQGSMAVAPGSHKASWRHDAYFAIGQNRTEDGGKTKEEIVRKTKANVEKRYPTCDMHHVNPQVHAEIEKSSRVVDIKRGDVIFATRLLFHRTLAVTPDGIQYYKSIDKEYLKRYSLRYVPGSARLPNGWSVEWSVVSDPANAGRSLDEIDENSETTFYPKVWPRVEENLEDGMDDMAARVDDLVSKANAEFRATILGAK